MSRRWVLGVTWTLLGVVAWLLSGQPVAGAEAEPPPAGEAPRAGLVWRDGAWREPLEPDVAAPTPPQAVPSDGLVWKDGRWVREPGAVPGEAGRGSLSDPSVPEAGSQEAYGAGLDAVASRRDAWPPYGVGNYRPPVTGTYYGRLRSQIRYETARVNGERESDLDFYQYLTLGTDGMLDDRLDTRFHGRWSKDIDGTRGVDTGEAIFVDARDAQRSDRHLFEIYTAYARMRAIEGVVDVTVGRQQVTEADWVNFDGISFDAPRLFDLVSVGGFAGRRVHFYDEFEEQGVAGGHIVFHLAEGIDLGLSDVASEVNLFEAKLQAELFDSLYVTPSFRLLEGEADRLQLDVQYWNAALGLEARLLGWRQLSSSKALILGLASADSDFRSRLRIAEPRASEHYELSVYKDVFPKLLGIEIGLVRHHLLRHRSESGWESSYWEPWIAAFMTPITGLHVDTRFTYADFHRPDVSPTEVFDDAQRTEGEEYWFEWQVGARYRFRDIPLFLGDLTVGADYIYREFYTHSAVVSRERLTTNAFHGYVKVDVTGRISCKVEYRSDEDLMQQDDGIQRSEAVWGSVEYAF